MIDRNKIRSLLVAEINDVEARVTVWARRGSGWTPVEAQTVDLSHGIDQTSLAPEDRNLRILEALKPLKLKAQYNVLLLPKQAVTTRLVTLPATEEDELKRMARYEAERQIPFNAERYIVSHHVVSRQGIEGSKVLIAAIDGDVLAELTAPFQALGIKFQEAVDTTQALFQLLPQEPPAAPEAAEGEGKASGQVSMVIHVGRRWTELVIVVGGQLRFSRSLSFGWETLAHQLQETGKASSRLQLKDLVNMDALSPESFFNESDSSDRLPLDAAPEADSVQQQAAVAPSAPPPSLATMSGAMAEQAGAEGAAANLRIELSGEQEDGEIKLGNGRSLTIHSSEEDHAAIPALPETAAQPAAPQQTAVQEAGEAPSPPLQPKKRPPRPSDIVRAWLNRLLGQVRRTWEFAQREEEHPPLELLLLSGAAANWRNLNQFLQVNLGCPCTRLDEAWDERGLKVDKKLALTPETWNTHAGGLLQVTGGRPMSVNLLATGYLKQQSMRQQYRQWAFTGVLTLMLLSAGWMLYSKITNNQLETYREYVIINKEYETRANLLLGALERVKILETQVNEKRSALEILDLLNSGQIASIPETVTLQKVNYQRNKELEITGFSKSNLDTGIFRKELEDTGLFDSVEMLQNTLTPPYRGAPVNVYKIVIKCYFPEAENN